LRTAASLAGEKPTKCITGSTHRETCLTPVSAENASRRFAVSRSTKERLHGF
jgi:hypothetical protein